MLQVVMALAIAVCITATLTWSQEFPLWEIYRDHFTPAKYVDLTHAFRPDQPVWAGFGRAKFAPAKALADLGEYAREGDVFTYEQHGFVATAYEIPTDQYGTQLDPPAHWDAGGASIDELPATYCVRPLVVIDVHEKCEANPGYHCSVGDIKAWEGKYGMVPEGSIVMIRSDWSRRWPDDPDFNQKPFPGVSLDALKYLHEERAILFHGHEPLDTDTTPTLEGEYWLMHNGYCQGEGVANLWMVPEAGALVAVGYAKPMGGTGGFARYIAICPPDWEYGTSVQDVPGAPLPKYDKPLRWDAEKGMRVR